MGETWETAWKLGTAEKSCPSKSTALFEFDSNTTQSVSFRIVLLMVSKSNSAESEAVIVSAESEFLSSQFINKTFISNNSNLKRQI